MDGLEKKKSESENISPPAPPPSSLPAATESFKSVSSSIFDLRRSSQGVCWEIIQENNPGCVFLGSRIGLPASQVFPNSLGWQLLHSKLPLWCYRHCGRAKTGKDCLSKKPLRPKLLPPPPSPLPPSSPPQIAPAELKCQLGPRPPAYRRKALAFISGRFELLPEQALAPLRGSQQVKHGGVCVCGSWPGQVRSATVSCVQTRRHPTTSKSAAPAPEHQQRRRLHTWKPFHIPSVLPLVIPDPTQGRDLLNKTQHVLNQSKILSTLSNIKWNKKIEHIHHF